MSHTDQAVPAGGPSPGATTPQAVRTVRVKAAAVRDSINGCPDVVREDAARREGDFVECDRASYRPAYIEQRGTVGGGDWAAAVGYDRTVPRKFRKRPCKRLIVARRSRANAAVRPRLVGELLFARFDNVGAYVVAGAKSRPFR